MASVEASVTDSTPTPLTVIWNERTGQMNTPAAELDVDRAVDLIQAGLISYPYRRFYLPPPDQLYQSLVKEKVVKSSREFSVEELQSSGVSLPAMIEVYKMGSGEGEALTDWFTEPERARGKVSNGIFSLYELWMQMTREVLLECVSVYDLVNTTSLRSSLRALGSKAGLTVKVPGETLAMRLAPETASFNNTLARALYEDFCPAGGVTLDFSSGWGDRLLGAVASRRVSRYIAIDPNETLHSPYSQIVDVIVKKNPLENGRPMAVEVLSHGAEQLPLVEEGTVDLVFTSPPYWDLEIYTQVAGQSVDLFSTFDSWLRGFLFEALRRSYYRLKSGGRLLLHIRDIRGTQLVLPVMNYMQELGSVYSGVVVIMTVTPGPVWIWTKP